jgi:hypothetical protein
MPVGPEFEERRRPRFLMASIATLVVGLLPALGAAPASASSYRSSGSITFAGVISGILKIPASQNYGGLPGCSISGVEGSPPHQGGYDIITWDNVKLRVGGKLQTMTFIELSIDVAEFGRSYSMVPNLFSAHAGVSLTIPADYEGRSGTATTSVGGKSGSLKGTLSPPKGTRGVVTITGSWAGCAPVSI